MSDAADLEATNEQASQALALAGFPGPLLRAIGNALAYIDHLRFERDGFRTLHVQAQADRAAVAAAMGIKRAGLDDAEFQAVIEERAAALAAQPSAG